MRNGVYTIYKGYHLLVVSNYSGDIMLYYYGKNCPFSNFSQSIHSKDEYYYVIVQSDIREAYSVKTFGLYKGNKVQVIDIKNGKEGWVRIGVKDPKVGLRLNMEEVDSNWFLKEIESNDLESIWEEREPALNLPMPKDIESKKIIL